MPVTGRSASFELVEFKWTLEAATNFFGLLGTTTLTTAIASAITQVSSANAQMAAATTDTQILAAQTAQTTARTALALAMSNLTKPMLLLNETIEGTAIGYSRTNCTPAGGSLVYSWDSSTGGYKTNETSFTKTITAGQTWDYQWAFYLRNAKSWANRLISSVDATANTITFPANGATFTTGDQVVITADSGGTLPGGLTQDPGSTRASVVVELSSPTGTTTITSALRPLGGGANIDITSVGSGSLRVRSADGDIYAYRIEDNQQAASGEITFKLTHYKRVFTV